MNKDVFSITQEEANDWHFILGGISMGYFSARHLLMVELKAKRGRQKIVEDRANRGVCLIDDCGREADKRGLCDHHKNQFYNERRKLLPEQQFEFEQEMVREGLVLPAQAVRKYRSSDNPFRETA